MAKTIFNSDSEFLGTMTATSIANATGDVVTIDGFNILKRRTYAEILTDLGGPYVDLANNQYTIGGEKTFTGAVQLFDGRVGVQTPVFGGSRLGDAGFQTPAIDTQAINFKDAGQLTGTAMFITPVGGSDGYTFTTKNFVDDVLVWSINGVGSATYGGALREVESTIGLRNDFTGGQFTVLDMFNQDYDAATEVADSSGWVAIHGGGATAKEIGLWRYDTTTYTPIWELSPANVWTFGIDINVPTEVYGAPWSASTEVPTKGDLYTKLEAIVASSGVSSFNIRTGAVVPAAGDYDAFYFTETESDARFARLAFANTYTGVNTFSANVVLNTAANLSMNEGEIQSASRLDIARLGAGTNYMIHSFSTDTTYDIYALTGKRLRYDFTSDAWLYNNVEISTITHTHTLSDVTDVTATVAEVNLLDLAGLTAGWVLSADTATTASWKAPSGGGGTWGTITGTLSDQTDLMTPTFTGQVTITGNELQIEGTSPRIDFVETASTNNWNIIADADALDFRRTGVTNNALKLESTGDARFYLDLQIDGNIAVGIAGTANGTITVDKNDTGVMALSYEDNYLRWRRGGGGSISGWRWDNFDSQSAKLTTAGVLTLGTDSITGTLNTNDMLVKTQAIFQNVTRWDVSAADDAHQRADARDDNTDEARLHWYGVNTTSGTECFRHAWYDGGNYMNITYLSDTCTWDSGGSNLTHHFKSEVDCSLIVEADSNNVTETDNPTIELWQDSALVKCIWGIEGTANTAFTGTIDNGVYWNTLSSAGYQWAITDTMEMKLTTNELILEGALNLSSVESTDYSTTTNVFRVTNGSGWASFGTENGSFLHIKTDRANVYFDKPIQTAGNQVRSYTGDFNLNRAGSTTARLRITSGVTYSDQDMSIDGFLLRNAPDRSGLLEISNPTAYSWYGIQITDDDGLKHWSVMGNATQFGLYDDELSEWILQYTENSAVNLYFNGSNKLATSSTGITVTGTGVATDWDSTSDRRLKTGDREIEPVGRINWLMYEKEGKTELGAIAQEVQEYAPYLVREDDTEDKMLSMSYRQLQILENVQLRKELDEANARLDRLELIIKELL